MMLFETARSISFFPEVCAVPWHCLLRQEQCCPQLWSSQSSAGIQTLFCMSVPGTCRKAAVTSEERGWSCWKSQSGGLSAFHQGICSVLCIQVVFNSLSEHQVFKFVLLLLKYKELEGSISCWSGNFKFIFCIHPDFPLSMGLPNCPLRVGSSKLDLSGCSWRLVQVQC